MSIKGYGYNDPYTYADSDVLKNKFDIRDADELEALERRFFAERNSTLADAIPMTVEGFLSLHHHLFQDIYEWAGRIRTVDISKGETRFCVPQYIEQELGKRFEIMCSDTDLAEGADRPHRSGPPVLLVPAFST